MKITKKKKENYKIKNILVKAIYCKGSKSTMYKATGKVKN